MEPLEDHTFLSPLSP